MYSLCSIYARAKTENTRSRNKAGAINYKVMVSWYEKLIALTRNAQAMIHRINS